MNKTELIAEVAKKCGMSKKDAEKAVTTTFDTIAEALSQGDKVQLVGFGGFETKKREARMGRNPKTKEAIKYLEDFSTQGDATISAQALFALANCYASDKQLDKAVDTFKKAAKATDVPALSAEYLFQAGLILENQKKNDEALQVYQQLKADYPLAPICSRQQQGDVVLDAIIDKYIEKLSK